MSQMNESEDRLNLYNHDTEVHSIQMIHFSDCQHGQTIVL